ncbi:acyl-CoA thioesterase [Geovibrio thiophilus]|uniref:Acyl-CoA thioesterase n=1 Tax=Geovibrio thiophilus TaxID=139438 RepID=A0A410K1V7_9BACT|nr:hotdog domain-containing protein [Geovibrio thiophilus]QAR34417.1 acyl-CoA thioesterase [Geovibrio thiophilus]
MDNYVLVRPEHLNHYGYLFGGMMLKWIDEIAWLAASLDFPGYSLVTVTMDKVIFKHRVENGSILKFITLPEKIGRTSVSYNVTVEADAPGSSEVVEVFSTNVKFVAIDKGGKPVLLPQHSELRSGKLP